MFDPAAYTTETKSITVNGTAKSVTYRFYKNLVYVTKPVNAKYQSLNVSVPVEIDGEKLDAGKAPILFSNSIGGYMSTSVYDATGIAGGGMPSGATAPGGAAPSGGSAPSGWNDGADRASNPEYALAAGYVVVEPGARGHDLVDSTGHYYGVAPAAIVDLKAAVRYVRHNSARIPGNTDRIISTGVSAGGAMSALLGASCDSPLYEELLRDLGAADASDAIFASADYCPITDLEHADGAYEWCWGTNPTSSGQPVDQTVSGQSKAMFADYQKSLNLHGQNNFGPVTADNYGDYLVRTHLQPSATGYLTALSDADRTSYLQQNSWISWADNKASFTWPNFLAHVGTPLHRLQPPAQLRRSERPHRRRHPRHLDRPHHRLPEIAFGEPTSTRRAHLTGTLGASNCVRSPSAPWARAASTSSCGVPSRTALTVSRR